MKTILYSIIAIFIFGFIAIACTNKPNTNTDTNSNTQNIVLMQAIDSDVSSVLLSESAKVISDRLKDFNSQEFSVNIIPEKNQIQVILDGDWDLEVTEDLLIQKGSFELYETYNRTGLSELLAEDNQLFSLFDSENVNDFSASIGCTSIQEVENINAYLSTLGLDQKSKFAWSKYAEDSDVCLYALKIDKDRGALITRSDIESVKFHQDKASGTNEIEIVLKESAVELWADATERNINHAIAFVLDDNVLSAPTVCASITGGRSSITGNFSETEAKYIASLGNNGVLPIRFNLVK
jgi:preprotein translocase subunit SecD